MNYFRAIFSGIFVWLLVVSTFLILENIPAINYYQQGIVALMALPLFSSGAVWFFYKNGSKTSGLSLGLVMTATALTLDMIITVPFIEIPKGGSYQSFFTSALLWALAFINTVTAFLYWKLKGYFHKNETLID